MALVDELGSITAGIKAYQVARRQGRKDIADQHYNRVKQSIATFADATGLQQKMFDLRSEQEMYPFKKREIAAKTTTAETESDMKLKALERETAELKEQLRVMEIGKEHELTRKTIQAQSMGEGEKIERFGERAETGAVGEEVDVEGMLIGEKKRELGARKDTGLVEEQTKAAALGEAEKVKRLERRDLEGTVATEVRAEQAVAEVAPALAKLSVENAQATVDKMRREVDTANTQDLRKMMDLEADLELANKLKDQAGWTLNEAWRFVQTMPTPITLIDRYMRADQVMEMLEKGTLTNVERAMQMLGPGWGAVQPTKDDLSGLKKRLKVVRDAMKYYLILQKYDLEAGALMMQAEEREGRKFKQGLRTTEAEAKEAGAFGEGEGAGPEISPSTGGPVAPSLDVSKMMEWAEKQAQGGVPPRLEQAIPPPQIPATAPSGVRRPGVQPRPSEAPVAAEQQRVSTPKRVAAAVPAGRASNEQASKWFDEAFWAVETEAAKEYVFELSNWWDSDRVKEHKAVDLTKTGFFGRDLTDKEKKIIRTYAERLGYRILE